MDFSISFENMGVYLEGLKNTLILVSISLAIGLAMALPMAVLRTSKTGIVQAPVRAFVWFFRGTPLLFQMFLVYYGCGQFEVMKESFLGPIFKEVYWCALFTFSLNTCAYTTQVIRSAILATPPEDIEAARLAGVSNVVLLRRTVLPSALKRSFPAYSNEIIFMLHGIVLTSVITLIDITGAAKIVHSMSYSPYEAFLTAALFYLAIAFTTVFLVRQLKKRWRQRVTAIEEGLPNIEASA